MSDDRPVIIDALRTPIGTTGQMFSHLTTTDLAAPVLKRLAERLPQGLGTDAVILGNIRGPGGNPARLAGLAAGLGVEVPALTLDDECGSGLAAVEQAWYRCLSRPGAVLAGGVQAASTQPVTMWPGTDDHPPRRYDRAPFAPAPWADPEMGPAADRVAAERGIDRARQDRYALRSHQRAVATRSAGGFAPEIVPVGGHVDDQRPRPGFTAQRLARFRPAFGPDGTATAANSCGISDGAAAVTMIDGRTFAGLGGSGLRVLSVVSAGCDPDRPGLGMVPAVRSALGEAGVAVDQLDAIEFNEAFAGQVLACADALGIGEERICPDGGAIALGHPWAASGAVLVVRLFTRLVRQQMGRYGLAGISIGGGLGCAMVVEACQGAVSA
ncbi:MAG: thiolase family protein [Acidipropionibacterium jensenii]|uniref:thiolase family protein n=4 Tax=Acidipropionibacterium jensenii TaxID=1749 RepID=UPI00110BCE06|nr:thiolase family protein [Acidipropionibacterium jensenii]MDN6479363.1 thiolase family protein [Acidipropionibacterium jensenii]QCV87634.1 thiolase family protein [Acidipropionibacterium jensenii]